MVALKKIQFIKQWLWKCNPEDYLFIFDIVFIGYTYFFLKLFIDLTDPFELLTLSIFIWNIFRGAPSYIFMFPSAFFICLSPILSLFAMSALYAERSVIYGFYFLLMTAFFGIVEIWQTKKNNFLESIFRGSWMHHVPFLASLLFVSYLGSIAYGKTLFVHDSSLYFTKLEALSRFGGLWKSDSFGYTDYLVQAVSFFSNILSSSTLVLGMSFYHSQLFVFFIILLLVWYGSWHAFKRTFDILNLPETLYSSFFASVLYTFNLYMIASWHGGTIGTVFLVAVAAPFILSLLLDLLYGNWAFWKTVIFALCIGISLNTAPYAVAIVIAFALPFLALQKRKGLLIRSKALVYVGIIALFISMIFVFLLSFSYLYSDPYPVRNNLVSYAFSDFGIKGIFRFFFEWTMDKSWGGRYFHSYYPYYTQWVVILSAFILWLGATFAFLRSFIGVGQSLKRKTTVIFVFLVALVSIFFAKANQAPLGDVNMFLYEHFPLFNMFRTPDTKFGLPVMLALSFLVGYFLAISKSYIVRLVVVASILIQVAPFFSATPIVEIKAGDEFQRAMIVPDAYQTIKDIVDNDKSEGFVLSVPGVSYGNFDYKNGTGLNGQDILGKMIDRPIMYGDNFIFGKSEKVYKSLTENFQSAHFNEYGIRYILVRKDILHNDTDEFSRQLDKNDTLEKVYESNVGDLYRIKQSFISPIIVLQDNNAQLESHFKADSSMQVVKIIGLRSKANLVFLQSFHPGWKVYAGRVNCQTCLAWQESFFDNNHHLVQDYANGWTIDPGYIEQNFPKESYHKNTDGSIDVDLTLYFKPQAYFYMGLIVSGTTLALCLWYLVWDWRRRKARQS